MNAKNNKPTPFKTKLSKTVAAFIAISILFQAVSPTCAFALTGGAKQPEVSSFEPVGTSDMVDLASGNFKYNLPLMMVDKYPINLTYNSGTTMDQEASWTGLSWNVCVGFVGHGVRGIPDDFCGDGIIKEFNMKPNKTFGVNLGAGLELFGLEKLKLGIDYSIGVKYNNYNGIGVDQSLNLALASGDAGKSPLSGKLGLNSSSDEGLSIAPSISFTQKTGQVDKKNTSLSVSVGCAFSGRGGLGALTMGVSQSVSSGTSIQGKYGMVTKPGTKSESAGGSVASSSFNFGMPTYTPNSPMDMQNLSITGSFKLGGEAMGLHPNASIKGYYSGQKLARPSVLNPAFGYLNADEGTKYDDAIMDFNREHDGPFTPSTPALPLTNFTYDIFSVSGQGVGGSYRPFRNDMGHVFDPRSTSSSDGYSVGGEVGLGAALHVGVDVTVNNVDGHTGRWTDDNSAASTLTHRAFNGNPLYEKYHFKEANEKSVDADPDFYTKVGEGRAKKVNLNQLSEFHTVAETYYTGGQLIPADNYRKKRERRAQPITMLNRGELDNGYGLQNYAGLYPGARSCHIAEVTALKDDGSRYVYGIAAYNKRQEEVTFAVGESKGGGSPARVSDPVSGLVSYVPGLDNSVGNQSGLDNYFSNTITPAFSHSYLLTAVLSPDYVDSDNIKGPSCGDIGDYTKFDYIKIDHYAWRVPLGYGSATFNEGLRSDPTDDKANYIYGEKELYYLKSIETKNYKAIFDLGDRKDGYGVVDKNGKVATANPMKFLKSISLYSLKDYETNKTNLANAELLKQVNFQYDYSLCPQVPNNINYGKPKDNGKLTLTGISFAFGKSFKASFSPYSFKYNTVNPSYHVKAYDRWGGYKPAVSDDLPAYEYPYVEQDKALADQYSQAWNLKEIYLPSGGIIKVDYESDDYAYVQDKPAARMFKIVDISSIGATSDKSGSTLDFDNAKCRLTFRLQKDINGNYITDIPQYFKGINYVYFRFLMNIRDGLKEEYVSGYAQIDKTSNTYGTAGALPGLGYISLRKVQLSDNGSTEVNPIVKAAIQYGRMNMSRVVWTSGDVDDAMNSESLGEELLTALGNSSFVKNISDAIKGPNKALHDTYQIGRKAVAGKSWIRLNNPSKVQFGGGCRVKQIGICDQWGWTGIADPSSLWFEGYTYGQQYSYALADGTSSGVASYEPQLGGDENPCKQPIFFDTEKLLAPDDNHYTEEPFGESFFPSPEVVYSRVTVQNIKRTNVTSHATGYVVHKFYTSKDFPVITSRTDLQAIREKNPAFSLSSIFRTEVKDYMTASQGFLIESNDMAGKPQSEEVYQEGQTSPITSVEYRYKSSPYLNGSFRLQNTCNVLCPDGSVKNAELGRFVDFVSDMRESYNETTSASGNYNTDGLIIPPIPAIIPIYIGLPSYTNEKTRFRSASITKVIQRFGILEETIAKDLGSTVATKNMAYDSETGEVLLTQTTTDFNDKVYSLTYPAYWYYNGMGPAYKNVGLAMPGITFNGGTANVQNALAYFAEGDEIIAGGQICWVIKVWPGTVEAVNRSGSPASGAFGKILRSGYRNQMGLPMATITSLANPLDNFQANIFTEVLQSQAMEYTNNWRTFCDCYKNSQYSTNPYILGTKGNYRNKRSQLYLTGRTQSNYNNNTNIRQDGVFTSYTPFYRLNAGKWEIDSRNWTYSSEVTEFSPYGPELETKDALKRHSSATYGYNQSLPTAVAANTKYSGLGFDNFEDYNFSTCACADNHFKFNGYEANISNTTAHTGRKSIALTAGASATMTKQLLLCNVVPDCDLKLAVTTDYVKSQSFFTVTGGTPPYRFQWATTGGCPAGRVLIKDTGDGIMYYWPGAEAEAQATSGANQCMLVLTVTDSKGCKRIFDPQPTWATNTQSQN